MTTAADLKPCFVIAPIGNDGSETRRRSDQVLKHLVKPAAEKCGYAAVRADEIDRPGLITSQVIQRVVGDPLVIADLTEMNPNVFYELAIRHAIRKPLVQIIEKGERIPFDVAATRTVHFDHKDLDSVASANESIVAQIKALELNPSDIETPISVSLELQNLRQSDDPADRNLAEVIAELADLRASIAKLAESTSEKTSEELMRLRTQIQSLIECGGRDSKFRNRDFDRFLRLTELRMNGSPSMKAMLYASVAQLCGSDLPAIREGALELSKKYMFSTPATAQSAEEKFQEFLRDFTRNPYSREVLKNGNLHPSIFELLDRLATIVPGKL